MTSIFFYCMREFDELAMAKELSIKYDIPFDYTTVYPTEDNMHLADGYEVVCATPCNITGTLIRHWHQHGMKLFTTHSIGYDHIDLQTCRELGVMVTNVSYPPSGVANYAIMMMMMILRRAPYIEKCVEAQDFTLKGKIGRDLSSCTVGIIGTGAIGETVARRLHGFGCRILALDIYEKDSLKDIVEYVSKEELFRNCDVITLHANANESNYHIVCKETLDMAKNGVVIINTARGKLIDTDALIDALESGKVGGCALDVMEHEDGLYYANRMYDVIDNRRMAILRSFPNVLLTPHTAFYTAENVYHMTEGNFLSAYHLKNNLPEDHQV